MKGGQLRVDDLNVNYGPIRALRSISFVVEAGTVCAIVGANGAGKSSILNAIGRSIRSSGLVKLDGKTLPRSAWRTARAGIGVVPEGRLVFSSLTVLENLRLGRLGGVAKSDLAHVWDLLPRLYERQSQRAGTLSGGEQQMLAIGRALLGRPRVLLLDEPSLGLAPLIADTVFSTIAVIAASGTTVVLVEQQTARAFELAHHVILLRRGEIVVAAPPGSISRDLLKSAYLAGPIASDQT